MFLDQLFEPNLMEKDLSPSDFYMDVTEDSVLHVLSSSWRIPNFTAKFKALPIIRNIKWRQIINLETK